MKNEILKRKSHIALLYTFLLFFCGCSDPVPQCPKRFTNIGSVNFGKNHRFDKSANVESEIVMEKFLTEADSLEISLTPLSAAIWKITLFIPEIPAGKEPLTTAKLFAKEKFLLDFGNKNTLTLPGTRIELSAAYDRGPYGVKLVFTDLEYEKIFKQEDIAPQTVLIRKKSALKNTLLIVEAAIRDFHNETGIYPENLNALLKNPGHPLWKGPYLDEIPLDPWNRVLLYERHQGGFKLYSSSPESRNI